VSVLPVEERFLTLGRSLSDEAVHLRAAETVIDSALASPFDQRRVL